MATRVTDLGSRSDRGARSIDTSTRALGCRLLRRQMAVCLSREAASERARAAQAVHGWVGDVEAWYPNVIDSCSRGLSEIGGMAAWRLQFTQRRSGVLLTGMRQDARPVACGAASYGNSGVGS